MKNQVFEDLQLQLDRQSKQEGRQSKVYRMQRNISEGKRIIKLIFITNCDDCQKYIEENELEKKC